MNEESSTFGRGKSMKIKLVVVLCLVIFTTIRVSGRQITTGNTAAQNEILVNQSQVKTKSIDLIDKARSREVPVELYSPATASNVSHRKSSKLKLAILNHGYGGKNTDYSFIANNLVAHGYFVASIQHQLPADEPLPKTGNPYETRKPNWERGVKNILFVMQELKKMKLDLDFSNLLLVGHSNGGDTAMLFAHEYPQLVRKVISLDNRRMPFPRSSTPQILSLRSSDQTADAGVLPTQAEQEKFSMKIIRLSQTKHDDMWDGATEKQKAEINEIISAFLEN